MTIVYACDMAYVILGLLLIRSMSLYDLVRAFEAGPSLFYSASSGSIKRAIDGLLRDGKIEVEHIDAGARGRKTYRITETGNAEFHTWMRSKIPLGNAEPAMLARLFFLGFVPADQRGVILDNIEHGLLQSLVRLRKLERQVAQAEVPKHLSDVAMYQRAVLAYGLATHQFSLDWFRHNLR